MILGVQLCFRRFCQKFEALFLKNYYLFMMLSRKNDAFFEVIDKSIHF